MSSVEKYYTFDDVFLIPQKTDCQSRSDLDTSSSLGSIGVDIPIISANMDTITGPEMSIAMASVGATSALHRFNTTKKAVSDYRLVRSAGHDCLVSVGVNDINLERASALYEAGARNFIVDIAHGHSTMMRHTLGIMRNTFGTNVYIVAGNIATPEAVKDLVEWGADCVKIGIGGGSCCSTRVITGHGVPMFTCLLKCCEVADSMGANSIADGGIRTSGDIVKAFAAGADFVMIGSLLSGTHETPGEIVRFEGKRLKRFRGMASTSAMIDRNNRDKADMPVGEGVNTTVLLRGPVRDVVLGLQSGLRSGMSYMGARNIRDIPVVSRWGAQTPSGNAEGKPHILMGENTDVHV